MGDLDRDRQSPNRLLAGGGGGGLLHPGGAPDARLTAFAFAAGAAAGAGGGGRAARAAATVGAADGCRQGVPAARPDRGARGRAGAAGGPLSAGAGDGRARDQHGPFDRGGDPARPGAVLAPAPPGHVRPPARVPAPLACGGLGARRRGGPGHRPAADRLDRPGPPARLGGVPGGALAAGPARLPAQDPAGGAEGPRLGYVRAGKRPARPDRERLRLSRLHAAPRGTDVAGGDGRPAGGRGGGPDAGARERDPRRPERREVADRSPARTRAHRLRARAVGTTGRSLRRPYGGDALGDAAARRARGAVAIRPPPRPGGVRRGPPALERAP